MNEANQLMPTSVLHWNYRGFTEFPIQKIQGEESEITDIYLKENLISRIPNEICRLENLESLYLSGNDITELPREIAHLKCLKCLDLSGNRIRRIPEEIGDIVGLKFLIVDENELTELPLRLAELRSLRYLSVCDNKIEWLAQRPVYNYHHCEFRFWRNTTLKCIPYSLWYHMFRDQQTRSLNIGCLSIPKYHLITQTNRCRLKVHKETSHWEFNLDCPKYHRTTLDCTKNSPASLFELSKRVIYKKIYETAKKLSTEDYRGRYSLERDINFNNVNVLENIFGEFCIGNQNNNEETDLNGNHLASRNNYYNKNYHKLHLQRKQYYVPKDIVNKYFNYLPVFLKEELSNGPISKCENVSCKKPVFDFVYYEFCIGKLILIDNHEDILLSAAFCSKLCADTWKRGKSNLLSWTLMW